MYILTCLSSIFHKGDYFDRIAIAALVELAIFFPSTEGIYRASDKRGIEDNLKIILLISQ